LPIGFLLKAIKGIDLDSNLLGKDQEHACYIKNLLVDVSHNDNTPSGEGRTKRVYTPAPSNFIWCGSLKVPDGKNFVIGFYESEETNEGYVFCWNSNSNHFIYRINGDGRMCEMIYQGSCLNFQLDPRYFIPPFRVTLKSTCVTDKKTGEQTNAKYLVFTDNFNEMRFIAVEDAIRTGGFNSELYPYFATNDPCCGPCNLINLGLPFPFGCIGIEPIYEQPPSDKSNLMLDAMFQFRITYTDRWGRPNEYGVISKPYFVSVGQCQSGANGRPRCLKLKIPAGCPTVESVEIAVRRCSGNAENITVPTDWSKYDTFNKYEDGNENTPWYERAIRSGGDITYNPEDNTFTYIFCNNKECLAIPVARTNRLFNPLPLTASSVTALGNSIAIVNCKEGYEPFTKDVLDKVALTVEPPANDSTTPACRPKTRKVRIEMVVQNVIINHNEPVWFSPEKDDVKVWGGLGSESGPTNTAEFENLTATDYRQYVVKDKTGFPGYFVGTNIIGYSKQYVLAPNRIDYEEKPFDDGRNNSKRRDIISAIKKDFIRVQVWEFDNVPEGVQIFRLAWHLFEGTAGYEKTSTYTWGRVSWLNYHNGGRTGFQQISDLKEIVIPCTGDYNNVVNDKFFLVVADLTRPVVAISTDKERSTAIWGYVTDDNSNAVDLAAVKKLQILGGGTQTYESCTDHNGFYFATREGKGITRYIYGKNKCVEEKFGEVSKDHKGGRQVDLKVKKTQTECKSNRIKITGVITDCKGVGISGIAVLLTRGGFSRTDVNGRFTIITHDTMVPNDPIDRSRDRLYIVQNGVCILSPCDQDCKICLDPIVVHIPACVSSCPERIFSPQLPQFKLIEAASRTFGLKAGGLYNFGIVGHDCMGRQVFVQNIDKYNLSIPSWQQTGVIGFPRILFNIDPSIKFPSWVKYITFWRTKNLAYGDFLQWVPDKVEYIDIAGNLAPDNPQKIKLYITGLVNYNLLYNLKTNVNYEFLKGDRIEFIAKNNGDLFTERISLLVTDSKDGDYIIVDYDERLKDMKGGELIQIIRNNACANKNFYFEITCPIKVVNGVPEVLAGELMTFDTYLFRRSIPYKVDDVVRSNVFPFPFEHHSPSDLWGDHCDDKGRVSVKNPYERQSCLKTKIKVSNAFVLDSVLNGLGRFDEADAEILDEQEWGAITALFVQLTYVLAICRNDNFVMGYREDRLRVNSSGTVVANSNIFGRPERKIGDNYGCQEEDLNTLREYQGLVSFIDSSKIGLIVHNFSEAKDISEAAGVKGHLSAKIREIEQFNQDNPTKKKFWHGGVDCKKSEYLLTSFLIDETLSYVNKLRGENVEANETFAFDLVLKQFKRAYSFTPEYYGSLTGHIYDNQLISFKNGLPWMHYRLNHPGQTYMNYFGEQCEPVYEDSLNIDPRKVKRYMWCEVHCRQQLLFADRVITESGQASRILETFWLKQEHFWAAAFQMDLNTYPDKNLDVLQDPAKLIYEGDTLYGKWIRVRLVALPENNGNYFEFDGLHIFVFGSEKSGTQ
jgi:hypothetical protein